MSERPPEQKALFDRVLKLLDASKAQSPATVEDVAQLSDMDAALALVLQLCADIDYMVENPAKYCGHCMAYDKKSERFTSQEAVNAHIVQCPHSPLVRAVWAALNAQATLDHLAAQERSRGHRTPEEREIEPIAHATIDALRMMVGR